jgi:MFS family permease
MARGTGIWMQFVALPLLVVSLGGTAVDLGLLAALQFGPILALAPVGGVLADRIPKRSLLIGLQAVSAIQSSVLAVLVLAGAANIGVVLVLAAIFGLVNAAEMPVRWSMVSELIPREDLANAIALHSAAFNSTRIIGPAIAGLLIAFVGVWSAFVWAATVSVLTAIMVMRIDPSRIHVSAPPRGNVGQLLTEGIRFAFATPPIRRSLGMLVVVSTFAMSFQAILPIFAFQELDLDSSGYGVLLGAMGVGALAAAVPMSIATVVWARWLRVVAPVGLAITVFALARVESQALGMVIMVVIGLLYMLSVSSINLTLQHESPGELRGRMLGMYVALLHGGTAVGGFLIGGITEATNAPLAMQVFAVVTALLAIAGGGLPSFLTAPSRHRDAPAQQPRHPAEGEP